VITVSCTAPPGTGGLGRHFRELLDDIRRRERLRRYYSTSLEGSDAENGEVVAPQLADRLYRFTPLRFSNAWRSFLVGDLFDRGVAARLVPAETYIGFAGQCRRTFRRAARLGYRSLELVSASSHVANVSRLHAEAYRRWPIERGWLCKPYLRKALREYQLADVIHVASEYSRRSFLAEGVAEGKLRRWLLSTHPRFRPAARRPGDGLFRIVYIGALTVVKGVPVLLEALRQLPEPDVRLTLVGGYGTRGMRRYLELASRSDARIRLCPGDPLPHLQQADVLVHPSFQDGFAYGPMEALACGVPVIVTEDTGMSEHVQEGKNGWVVSTGSSEAIADRVRAVMSGALPARTAAVPSLQGEAVH
jgi:glycosyltransferase involved in cell wall biosynthesis